MIKSKEKNTMASGENVISAYVFVCVCLAELETKSNKQSVISFLVRIGLLSLALSVGWCAMPVSVFMPVSVLVGRAHCSP